MGVYNRAKRIAPGAFGIQEQAQKRSAATSKEISPELTFEARKFPFSISFRMRAVARLFSTTNAQALALVACKGMTGSPVSSVEHVRR